MILDGVTLSTQIGAKVRWGRMPPCSGGRIQGSALPKGALLLQEPGPPRIHVSAEVAVPALSSQRGSAAVAVGSGSAGTGHQAPAPGPRPPAPCFSTTLGASATPRAVGGGWLGQGCPPEPWPARLLAAFPRLLGSQSLPSYPGRQGTRRCPYCGWPGEHPSL